MLTNLDLVAIMKIFFFMNSEAVQLWQQTLFQVSITSLICILILSSLTLISFIWDALNYDRSYSKMSKFSLLIAPELFTLQFIVPTILLILMVLRMPDTPVLFAFFLRLIPLSPTFWPFLYIPIFIIFIFIIRSRVLSSRSIALLIATYWVVTLVVLLLTAPYIYEQIFFKGKICFGLSCR